MEELIKKYHELNSKKKEYDKQRKKVSKEIQSYLDEQGLSKLETNNFKVTKIERNDNKIDEERLLEIIKKHNIDAVKDTVDEDKLEDLIDEGKIEEEVLEEISECITDNGYSYILTKERKG